MHVTVDLYTRCWNDALPSGHRPIELAIPTTGSRLETGVDQPADDEGAWR
jgi:hypothetical protein